MESTSSGMNTPAMVTGSVFFDWKIRIDLKTLRFNEMRPARGMDVKQMKSPGSEKQISARCRNQS
jgi:hypothetical protein